MLPRIEAVIKNGQSKDTGTLCTKHRTKLNKTKKTTQKTKKIIIMNPNKKIIIMDPNKKPGG